MCSIAGFLGFLGFVGGLEGGESLVDHRALELVAKSLFEYEYRGTNSTKILKDVATVTRMRGQSFSDCI